MCHVLCGMVNITFSMLDTNGNDAILALRQLSLYLKRVFVANAISLFGGSAHPRPDLARRD